jgi:hypothetical protein
VKKSDILATDFKNLEQSLRTKVIIEIFHNMHLIPDDIYFTKYSGNAEALDRDYKIWKELKDI